MRYTLLKVLGGIVGNIGGFVVARLPHVGTVAVGHRVHNPAGQVLGRRVEVQHLVQVAMVDLPVDQSLDFGEVAHHAVAVQFLGTAIDVDFPVVAVEVLAFALVIEVQLVAGGYFKGFADVIHRGLKVYKVYKVYQVGVI